MKIRFVFFVALCLQMAACSSSLDEDAPDIPGLETVADTAVSQDLVPEFSGEMELAAAPDATEILPEVVKFQCRATIPERIVADNEDATFDLGPYLMAPTPNAITVMWRTLEEEDGAVLYGVGDDTSSEIVDPGEKTIHAVRIEGLQPDTRYAYKVRSGTRTSDVHHFYTAPEEGGSFQFASWGDNQGGDPFPDLIDAIVADAPHVLLGLGDHVGDGRIDWHWKDHLFDPGRKLFHEVPLFAAFGNHGKNGILYYKLMGYENLAISPESESVYSWTYGNTFFLVVDTNGLFFDIGEVETEWSTWIKQQMASPAAQEATWHIAYAHEPGAVENSSQVECGGTVYKPVTGWLLPLLDEHGFHAYMCGHAHLYERTMFGNLAHIVSGGGGGGLEYCEEQPAFVSHLEVRHHFIRGLVGCDTLRLEAVALDTGEVFDFIELGTGPAGTILDQGPTPFYFQDPQEATP